MINARFEVDRLRQTLIFKGLSDREADHLANLASQDIAVAVTELLTSALSEAAYLGEQLGIDDFSEQVRAVQVGSTYQIVTDSGKSDFSVGEMHMLPHLLKNPKRAKDGSLYKVIPMKNKSSSKQIRSIFDAQRDQQEAQKAALAKVQTENMPTGADPLSPTVMFSGLAAAKDFVTRKQQLKKLMDKNNEGGPKEFRTASSKQDPSTAWVLPAKQRDMTAVLVDLNRQLENNIQLTIASIVRQYEELI